MKRKLLKKLVCLFGMLFITFPAWSAVPSNLLPDDGSWNQAPAVADVENPVLVNPGVEPERDDTEDRGVPEGT